MATDAAAENLQPPEDARPEVHPQDDELATPERIKQAMPGIEDALRGMDVNSIAGDLRGLNQAIDKGDELGTLRWAKKLDQGIFMSGVRKFWDHLVPNFMQKYLYNMPLSLLKPLVDAGFLELGGVTPQQFNEKLAAERTIKEVVATVAVPEFRAFGPLMQACNALNRKETAIRHMLIEARCKRKADEARHEHGHPKGEAGAANLDRDVG